MNKTIELKNGVSIPNIGLGTWRMGKDVEERKQLLNYALNVGYRLIDTAYSYENEKEIGEAIKESEVERSNLFVTNKVWTEFRSYDGTIKLCNRSLKAMGLEYFDSYLIHMPASYFLYDNWEQMNLETWKAMEYLYDQGLVRSIGLSNFKPHHMKTIMDNAKVLPMLNQIEFHPGQREEETVNYCKLNNIVVQAWSPLGKGKMLKKKELIAIADKYDTTVAKICLKWCQNHGIIPIPRSSDMKRIRDNYELDEICINKEDMDYLDRLPFLGGSRLDPDKTDIFESKKKSEME